MNKNRYFELGARWLEDKEANEAAVADDDTSFLSDYCQQFLSCKTPKKAWKEEDDGGPKQPNVVIFRLCYDCLGSDNHVYCESCSEGYGEYIIGLNSFLEIYFESYKPYGNYDNNNGDFDYRNYAYCTKYHQDDDGAKYYVGPTCTSDEEGVRLGFFLDKHCTTESNRVTFEDIAGYELPYSEGGLVLTSNMVDSGCNLIPCQNSCGNDDDDGCAETLNAYCVNMYETSGKCERHIATTSASSGRQTESCGLIDKLVPHFSKRMGYTIDFIVLTLFMCGLAGCVLYRRTKKLRKQKQHLAGVDNDGLMSGTPQ